MAYRDRLAASRAQRGQHVELSNLSQGAAPTSPTGPTGDLSDLPAFLAEDSSIQEGIQHMKNNVARIAALRLQTFDAIGDSAEATATIDALTNETRALMQSLKGRIQRMGEVPMRTEIQLRTGRINLLRTKFTDAIQDYQREEQEGRAKSRGRVERQLKIVKPDATPQEVSAAIDGGGQQIFAQALTSSVRYGESRAAYREVQERQQEIQKVEATLAELAQLFTEMAVLVAEQDVVINKVEETAADVTIDTEAALKNTNKAVVHARAYRKKRWICFFIALFVAAVLAIVLGIVFGKK